MQKYQLNLGLDPNNWRLYAIRDEDKAFKSLQDRIFKRDGYQCAYCGFRAVEHLCVVNADQNYKNNKGTNLLTACPFCAQCHFVSMIGSGDFKGGTMIYLPEVTQVELNALAHVLFCAIVNATDYSALAQNIYNNLRLRSRDVEQNFGKGLSDPKMFAQMLIDAPVPNIDTLSQKLCRVVRILPSRNDFSNYVLKWSQSALQTLV